MNLSLLSFLSTEKTGDAIGDFEGWIRPLARFSSRNLSSSFCLTSDIGYTFILKGCAPGTRLIAWSHCFHLGSLSKDSLEKMSRKAWYCSGSISSRHAGGEVSLAASASHVETVDMEFTHSESFHSTPTGLVKAVAFGLSWPLVDPQYSGQHVILTLPVHHNVDELSCGTSVYQCLHCHRAI